MNLACLMSDELSFCFLFLSLSNIEHVYIGPLNITACALKSVCQFATKTAKTAMQPNLLKKKLKKHTVRLKDLDKINLVWF